MKKLILALSPLLLAAALPAQALIITNPSLTTSADSCYTGCTNNPANRYDHTNILDGDFGETGNTGFNAWNSGFWGGWVQVDFGDSYVLDRIELYAWNNTYDPYTLLASDDGVSWSSIVTGGYHAEVGLTYTGGSGTAARADDWGGVHDVSLGTLGAVQAQFLRYSVNASSPHWGYLFELVVDGHLPVVNTPSPSNGSGTGGGANISGGNAVPEPASLALLGLGLGLMAWRTRRKD